MQAAAIYKGRFIQLDSITLQWHMGYCHDREQICGLTEEPVLVLKPTEALFIIRFCDAEDWIALDDAMCYTGHVTHQQVMGMVAEVPGDYDTAVEKMMDECL